MVADLYRENCLLKSKFDNYSIYFIFNELRIKYNIYIEIRYNMQSTKYWFIIIKNLNGNTLYPQKDPDYKKSSGFKTYEAALRHGIKVSKRLIK